MAEVNESIVPQKTDEPYWYVVHTYSGYEKKVKANIEKTIENRHLENEILEVQVPVKEVVEIKDGKKRKLQKKLFPGYVLIKMVYCQKYQRSDRFCRSRFKSGAIGRL